MAELSIRIQNEAFSLEQENNALLKVAEVGALVSFVGVVRATEAEREIRALQIEHYPGMTEKSVTAIASEHTRGKQVLAVRVVHRVGRLAAGENIVYVGVCAHHRADAFDSAQAIMDFLKTEAPFWKKEISSSGERWIEQKASDVAARHRWQTGGETA